jgi:hypothetical protein
MATKSVITAAHLRDAYRYDPLTGKFSRTTKRGKWGPASKVGGLHRSKKHRLVYLSIYVNGRQYLAHRLAWLYMTGAWPRGDVDHINGDGLDNRWANLRDVSHQKNSWNRSSKGVYLTRNGTWMARTKDKFLGVFRDFEDAVSVYRLHVIKQYGEHAHENVVTFPLEFKRRILLDEIQKTERVLAKLRTALDGLSAS